MLAGLTPPHTCNALNPVEITTFVVEFTGVSTVHKTVVRSALALAAVCAASLAQAVVTFDEIPPRPANGAVIEGVSFTSSSLFQIGVPPRALPGISGAALYGNGGGFEVAFAPTDRVSFDIAVSVPPGTNIFGIATFLAGGAGGFTLAQIGLTPVLNSAGVGSLRIDLPFTGGAKPGAIQFGFSVPGGIVALDNLDVGAPVPEPSTALLALFGVGGVIGARAWRRRQRTD
jgi:PEP-CTERM motif